MSFWALGEGLSDKLGTIRVIKKIVPAALQRGAVTLAAGDGKASLATEEGRGVTAGGFSKGSIDSSALQSASNGGLEDLNFVCNVV